MIEFDVFNYPDVFNYHDELVDTFLSQNAGLILKGYSFTRGNGRGDGWQFYSQRNGYRYDLGESSSD